MNGVNDVIRARPLSFNFCGTKRITHDPAPRDDSRQPSRSACGWEAELPLPASIQEVSKLHWRGVSGHPGLSQLLLLCPSLGDPCAARGAAPQSWGEEGGLAGESRGGCTWQLWQPAKLSCLSLCCLPAASSLRAACSPASFLAACFGCLLCQRSNEHVSKREVIQLIHSRGL